jgi:DNA-binding NarL/FixJ family response regulator
MEVKQPDTHSVLLVDDHQLVLDGIEALLKNTSEFEVLATAANGKEAIAKVQMLRPELVLIDLDMPVMNGLEATRQLRKNGYSGKIVVLSMHKEQAVVKQLMAAGANGFLVKDSPREEFIHCLRLVMQGKASFSSTLTEQLFSGQEQQLSEKFLSVSFSEREIEVLRLLVEGYSTKEIASLLHIGTETVTTHRKNMLQKTNARNVAHLVKIALKTGVLG